MDNFKFVRSSTPIARVYLSKGDVTLCVDTAEAFNDLVANGYVPSEVPTPSFNPNEVTRVADIIELHRRGINVVSVGSINNQIVDERSDFAKLNSPNYEADKLYPSFTRVSAEFARINPQIQQAADNLQAQIEFNDKLQSSTTT